MTEPLKIKINDKEYRGQSGRHHPRGRPENDIDTIPTLCHDPKLPPYGSCYLCVVEVEGLAKLVPSCSSPVRPGWPSRRTTSGSRESRRTALELLLSNHYADCLGPCTQTCPAGVDVQGYIALMAMGRYRDAVKLIKEKNPLPLVCGRVCVQRVRDGLPAEPRRRPGGHRLPEALRRRHRHRRPVDPGAAAEERQEGGHRRRRSRRSHLRLLPRPQGYAPTIFESLPKLGGMLRYGIPEYRLPKASSTRRSSGSPTWASR